ncbi:hypothetical protein [Entomospira culicis]|uniref:Uncharacterized protein n=1 Tax=Entomospira culicis TaxID=2719989 RepID=A0A968KU28_9SPIO|nr:hypothetical protein [Entomospira culicis]NIZ18864.1 hypothetical protein [Entomospira culicis]NIZ69079.1 hypothetical protein [Entomospira culicis]WDI37666.1 hypothetical protein PVA46_02470 [Entomospira culicis]WDI39294.1 hypothetical protein PVA47_02475 [Entomospira culicis]
MAANNNFFTAILDLLFGSKNDPQKERARMLRGVESILKKRGKYFKVGSLQVQPGMARFFHDIHTVVGPASTSLQNIMKSQQIRAIIIESFLSKESMKTINLLRSDEIEKAYVQMRNAQALKDHINSGIEEISMVLSSNQIAAQVNMIYSYLVAFAEFCMFDYYYMLHKFDDGYPENNFKYKPTFHSTAVSGIAESLDEFLHIALGIMGNVDWNKIFAILHQYRNVELINRGNWDKVLASTRDMVNEETIQLIIRLAKEDPYYEANFKPTRVDIIKPYLASLKDEAKKQIGRIVSLERSRLMSKVLQEIFNTTEVTVFLKNYNKEKNNAMLVGKGTLEYQYHEVLNTAVLFAYEYLDKDIKTLVDLLILKGKWSQNMHYKEFSAAFQALLPSADDILKFDATLSEDSTRISRLRNALRSVDKDKFAKNTVNGILDEINSDARDVMMKIAGHYMTLGRYLKIYIEDYKLQLKSEIIINWREIEKGADRPNLGKYMVELYTKVYYLVQMFQQFSSK